MQRPYTRNQLLFNLYEKSIMSLATVQQVLAQIYTNSKLRDDFLSNPDAVGRTLGLNCQEIQQLSQLSSQEVNLFANSLKRKRLGAIHKLLPLTNKVLNKEFDRLFFRYAETYLPTGSKKHLFDAIQFAQFIEQMNTTEYIKPAWVLDVLRYERIELERLKSKTLLISDRFLMQSLMGATPKIALHRFNYEIEPLIHSLQSQDSTPVLNLKANLAIWFRFYPNQQWRSLFIPIPNFPYFFKRKVLSN